ncbi:replication initiation and membrane attachment family protein [Salinicoccus sp. HZC-1]|uniref:replication initiation and membrane attachment family protein n=1 Tax=Salinicoccus sp. HZC-1 TaxID=3385497 RepID=UPI00398B0D1F
MMNFNERLKPNTEFIIYRPARISTHHLDVINELYLPLIQSEATMLYIYLNESTSHYDPLAIRFHKEIMDEFGIPLSKFSNELEKLEAIGLVRSYVSNEAHDDLFIYEVLLPLTPDSFFKDPMLSLYLYNKIGPDAYRKKKERLIYPKIPGNISEVTRKFTEVFTPGSEEGFSVPHESFQKENHSTGPNMDLDDFDFEVLFTHLKGTKIDKAFFTKEIRMLIVKLSVLFDLNAYDIKQILLSSTTQYAGIDKEQLKYEARRYYQKENGSRQPKLQKEDETAEAVTEETGNSYIDSLENINPLDRLNDIRNFKPSDQDLKLVTDIIAKTSLPNGVINLLLEYVYQQKQGDLNYPYTMKIAKDWEAKGIRSAKDAYQSIMDFRQQKKNASQKYSYKERQGERRPAWMDKKEKSSDQKPKIKKEEKPKDQVPQKTAKDDPEIQKMIEEFRKSR